MASLKSGLVLTSRMAKADDEGEDVEVADEAGGIEHALARFLGVTHGEEAHQDVGQAGGTEHQGQTQRDGGDGIGDQATRAHDGDALLVHLDRFTEQGADVEVDRLHHHDGHEAGSGEQHHRLDDLHPGGGQHAAKQYVEHHQDADQHHGHMVLQAEQQLDELAGTDHLGDQVEGDHHQRAAGGESAHLGLLEAIGGHVGKGVLAEVAQPLRDQEQDDGPAHQKADGVDKTVVAGGVDQRRDAEERGGRHVVTGDGQTVLEAGDAPAGGVVVGGRAVALGGPVGDEQGRRHEDHEHDDGRDVEGLAMHFAGQRIGCQQGERCQQGRQQQKLAFHDFTPLRIFWFSSSNSPLARNT